MATKEENLNRLRQLAGLPGARGGYTRGVLRDIAQRVILSCGKRSLCFPGGIMPGDESGPEQNHTGRWVSRLHNTDAPDDVKAVRVRKCLHVMGYCTETGRPVELTYRGMRVLVPSPLATAHDTATERLSMRDFQNAF
ncbi:DNA-packaging protein FI [Escherichia coli]|uniref:DNA-packaging protein FI n=1 Tax=Escherichia coli TaxID=562 RepID=UPI002FCD41B5